MASPTNRDVAQLPGQVPGQVLTPKDLRRRAPDFDGFLSS